MNLVRHRWVCSLLFGAVISVSVGGIVNSLAPVASAEAAPEKTAEEEKAADETTPAEATDGDATAEALAAYIQETDYTINTLIMFICAVLVIFMQAGFAMVEIGLNSAKNAVNILDGSLCWGASVSLYWVQSHVPWGCMDC